MTLRAKRLLGLGLSALVVSACLEPQIAPELSETPSSEFVIETIADELSAPWAVASLPDGSYLITERDGRLWRAQNQDKIEITGLPDDIYAAQQGGLLDIVLSPDFETDGQVYLTYSYGDAGNNGTAIFKAGLSDNALINGAVIFRASPAKDTAAHFGGRLSFLEDGSLLLTLGDGFVYREASQDLTSHLGKIIRITNDGGTPVDNPNFNNPSAKPQIYSYGHRNVQGVHYDAPTKTIWSHEHGPRGGDELNIIKPGANYGWPLVTTGTDYTGAKITPKSNLDGIEPFITQWTPSIAPSGLVIYRGDLFPEWKGDAFIGGLASRDLRRIDLEGNQAVSEEKLLGDLNMRVRDVREDRDGSLLVVLDDPENGQVLRLSPK